LISKPCRLLWLRRLQVLAFRSRTLERRGAALKMTAPPSSKCIQLTGGEKQSTVFRNNVIDGSGESPIHVNSDANGSVTFENNVLHGAPAGQPVLVNESKGALEVKQANNSWQKP